MIYSFNTNSSPSQTEVGHKGLSLIRMTQNQFPVPPGIVLTVAFFDPWITTLQATPEWETIQTAISQNENLSSSITALKATCANLKWTEEQKKQFTLAIDTFPIDSQFVIRYSPLEEDVEDPTLLGGCFKATLGVTAAALQDAIYASFCAAFDERVIIYKLQHGLAFDHPRIAIILQQQVNAESIGIGFSLNLLNNDYDEALISTSSDLDGSSLAQTASSNHFVVDKLSKTILNKQYESQEAADLLPADYFTADPSDSGTDGLYLTEEQAIEITTLLVRVEALFQVPTSIEWAFVEGKLLLLQARPFTKYIPLPPEMLTEPGERRILYRDSGLTDGVTIKKPMTPLTLTWRFRSVELFIEPFLGPISLRQDNEPSQNLMFAAGGRFYLNLSQLLTIVSVQRMTNDARLTETDTLPSNQLETIDERRYRAKKKIPSMRLGMLLLRFPQALWHSRHFVGKAISAFWNPERFYNRYERGIDETLLFLKQNNNNPSLTLGAYIDRLYSNLIPIFSKAIFPILIPYHYHFWRLDKQIGNESEENRKLVDSILMGLASHDSVEIAIHLFRLSNMLAPAEFTNLDHLAQQIKQREISHGFLAKWDEFIAQYGNRGPGDSELANPRYGDNAALALEQMSDMVNSDFNPEIIRNKRIIEGQQAYRKLHQKLNGGRRRQFEQAFEMVKLLIRTRDMPQYLIFLANETVRQRALLEGIRFVEQGRLDAADDIFWLTPNEVDEANANPAIALRQLRTARLPFYRKLEQYRSLPHLIDSRGRTGKVIQPQRNLTALKGQGIVPGVKIGSVKILKHQREKPVAKGDVLVAYTTDLGWTQLFFDAAAVILEESGFLQHGGVIAREYGKPCVVGIQNLMDYLHDGQLVEVNGTTGVIRLLPESTHTPISKS